MLGMLAPVFEEIVTGEAEVRQVFRVPRVGAIAGCYVRDGVDHPGLQGPLPARGRRHLEGCDHLAPAVQGRRPRGAGRIRVRDRPLRLPGPQGGRHHRDLRGAGDPPHLSRGRRPTAGRARPVVVDGPEELCHVVRATGEPPPIRAVAAGQPGAAPGGRRGARASCRCRRTTASGHGHLGGHRSRSPPCHRVPELALRRGRRSARRAAGAGAARRSGARCR